MPRPGLLLVALFVSLTAAQCPSGTYPTSSDAGYCTTYATDKYDTFDRAYFKCWNQNGRLSRMANIYDNAIAVAKVKNDTSVSQSYFYIGLKRLANMSWIYADDDLANIPVTYLNWAAGEPSTAAKRSCAVLDVDEVKWYAVECGLQLPFFCDFPTLHDPLFCTDTINADVFFMIDNSGDANNTRMMHDVLSGFNTAMRSQWWWSSSCSSASLSRQQTRVTGLLFFNDTWANVAPPNFCSDNFLDIVDSMYTTGPKAPIVTDLSVAIDVAKMYTERQGCACRRTNSTYNTRQLMVWIPMRDEYNTSRPISLAELPTWEHYLLDIRVNKTSAEGPNDIDIVSLEMRSRKLTPSILGCSAKYPLWKDPHMRDVNLPGMWPEFIPTQILRLWRLLCNVTKQPGDVPLPPLI